MSRKLDYAFAAFVSLIMVACLNVVTASADEPLKLEIFISEPDEINVTSAMIMGKTEMMVMSAQATKSAAIRLADRIEATGLKLKYIYLSHPHLDHAQGAGILLERFPEAKFIATPGIARVHAHRIPFDDATASARYGDNAAVPSVPAEPYEDSVIKIDGETVEIWADLVGDPGLGPWDELHTALYIPSLNALLPSDIIYFDGHVMMGGSTPESRAAWMKQIDGWIARDFDVVVPGHMPKTSLEKLTAKGALQHSRDYIGAYDKAIKESATSKEVIERMISEYPTIQHQSALYLGTFVNFRELRNISFDPNAKSFGEGKTEEEIAEIDRQRFEALFKSYNPE